MMPREKFKIGDWVVMTPAGESRDGFGGPAPELKTRTGTVTGFTHGGQFVRVRRYGQQTSGAYWAESWRVANAVEVGLLIEAQSAVLRELDAARALKLLSDR